MRKCGLAGAAVCGGATVGLFVCVTSAWAQQALPPIEVGAVSPIKRGKIVVPSTDSPSARRAQPQRRGLERTRAA